MSLNRTHVFGVKISNAVLYAQKIEDSQDLLLEFFIDNTPYRQEIVKPGDFWYTWFLKKINEAPGGD